MARYTRSDYNEHLGRGSVPRWFVHRYKSELSGVVADAEIGSATDVGVDPAITGITYTREGTSGVCEMPTRGDWSSGCEAMLFHVNIEGNDGGGLLVDLEFYEAKYGSTGVVEEWRHIGDVAGLADGKVTGVETDGGRVFARVSGITNPDGGAQLYLSCRKAHHSTPAVSGGGIGGGGGGAIFLDEELSPVGNYVWDGNDWVRAAGSASGATTVVQPTAALLNCTEASAASILTDTTAILADTAAIQVAVELIDDAVEDHDVALSDDAIMRVGGQAHAGTPPAVGDLDNCRFAFDLTQSADVHLTQGLDHTTSSVAGWEVPASGVSSGTTAISNAAATSMAAASTPCIRVTIQNRATNAGSMAVGDSGIAGVNEGAILVPGASITLEIDDVAKVYAWASALNDDCDWIAETR